MHYDLTLPNVFILFFFHYLKRINIETKTLSKKVKYYVVFYLTAPLGDENHTIFIFFYFNMIILEHKKLFTNHDGFLFLVEPLLWFSVLKGSVENKQKMYAKR